MGDIVLYYNCTLLRGNALVKDDLWVQNKTIIDPQTVNFICDDAVDCGGAIISPGFIDLKMNGGYGVDFSRTCNLQEAADKVAQELPRTGVTSFSPTLVTCEPDYYKRVLPQLVPRNGSAQHGAGIIGLHLDGPFISPQRVGAHDPSLVRGLERGFESVHDVLGRDLSSICLVSLAPELPKALDVIKELVRRRIRVSLGHSVAGLEVAKEAVYAGASMITHLFNAMPAFHHRDPSLVGLLATDFPGSRRVRFGLIADGHHTHPAALRMAYRIAPESLFLLTDAAPPLGLGEGQYTFGSTTVVVTDGGTSSPRCTVQGTDTLSGSVAPLDACIRNLREHVECSVVYALEAATLRPAEAMSIQDTKGTLDFETHADFVLLDPETLTVLETYIEGRRVYTSRHER